MVMSLITTFIGKFKYCGLNLLTREITAGIVRNYHILFVSLLICIVVPNYVEVVLDHFF